MCKFSKPGFPYLPTECSIPLSFPDFRICQQNAVSHRTFRISGFANPELLSTINSSNITEIIGTINHTNGRTVPNCNWESSSLLFLPYIRWPRNFHHFKRINGAKRSSRLLLLRRSRICGPPLFRSARMCPLTPFPRFHRYPIPRTA